MNVRHLWCAAVSLMVRCTFGYGPDGHQVVGAIADIRLKNTAVYQSATGLLHGITLQRASILPDQIKAWDTKRLASAAAIAGSTWDDIPIELKRDLFEFWKANPPTSKTLHPPSHHIFHYTDVSIDGPLSYVDAKAGINTFDIAHMIPYCVGVLKGDIAENNDQRITKAVALILLVHFVGDLHQPLHVGAAYFNSKAQRRAPKNDHDTNAKPDTGGNAIYFRVLSSATSVQKTAPNLHHFWDESSVLNAFHGLLPASVAAKDRPRKAAEELTKTIPAAWNPDSSDIQKWTINKIDHMLPIAKEAHDRLRFKKVTVIGKTKTGATTKKAGIGADTVAGIDKYSVWCGSVTSDELQFAGLDLAELVKRCFAAHP